jgi:hypothetical protein
VQHRFGQDVLAVAEELPELDKGGTQLYEGLPQAFTEALPDNLRSPGMPLLPTETAGYTP